MKKETILKVGNSSGATDPSTCLDCQAGAYSSAKGARV